MPRNTAAGYTNQRDAPGVTRSRISSRGSENDPGATAMDTDVRVTSRGTDARLHLEPPARRPHTTPLACIHHRDGIAVVASNGGSYRPPDWWLNLQRQPVAEVEFAGTKHAVVARIAGPTEHAPLTNSFGQAYPRFERYRQR